MTLDLDLDDLLQRALFLHGRYEQNVADLLRHVLRPGDVFVDVGANIGLHSLYASKLVGRSGRVYAFEPLPSSRARLVGHLALNAAFNVIVASEALSDTAGIASLFEAASSNIGKSSLAKVNADLGMEAEAPASHLVRTTTLDAYLSARELLVRVLKVDVEGAELLVMRGASRMLSAPHAPIVIFEASELLTNAFGYATNQLKHFLKQHGYNIFRFCPAGLVAVPDDELHRLEDLVAIKAWHFPILNLTAALTGFS